MVRPDDHVGMTGAGFDIARANRHARPDAPRGTSSFERTAFRSFSQSTSALLWGVAGDRGDTGHNEVLLARLYFVASQ